MFSPAGFDATWTSGGRRASTPASKSSITCRSTSRASCSIAARPGSREAASSISPGRTTCGRVSACSSISASMARTSWVAAWAAVRRLRSPSRTRKRRGASCSSGRLAERSHRINSHLRFAEHLAFVKQRGLSEVVSLAIDGGKSFSQDPRGGLWAPVLRRDALFADAYARQDADRYQLLVAATARSLFDRDTAPGAEPEDLAATRHPRARRARLRCLARDVSRAVSPRVSSQVAVLGRAGRQADRRKHAPALAGIPVGSKPPVIVAIEQLSGLRIADSEFLYP